MGVLEAIALVSGKWLLLILFFLFLINWLHILSLLNILILNIFVQLFLPQNSFQIFPTKYIIIHVARICFSES